MARPNVRWVGILVAVLVVGGFALYAASAGPRPAPAGSAFTVQPQPATSPPTVQAVPGMSPGTMIGLVLKVGIVAALLGGSLWLLRRYAGAHARPAGRTGAVTVADTLALAQGRVLYFVDVGDRALVIGATPQNLSLVGEVTDAVTLEKLRAPAPAMPSPLADISQRFEAVMQGLSRPQAAAAARAARRVESGVEDGMPSASFARALAGIEAATPSRPTGADAPHDDQAWPAETAHRPIGRAQEPGAPGEGDPSARLRALADRLRAARETT